MIIPYRDAVLYKLKDKYGCHACFARYNYESKITFFISFAQIERNLRRKLPKIKLLKNILLLKKYLGGITSIEYGKLKPEELENTSYYNLEGYFITIDPNLLNYGKYEFNKKSTLKILLFALRGCYTEGMWDVIEISQQIYLSNKYNWTYVQILFIITQLWYKDEKSVGNSNHWLFDSYPLPVGIKLFNIDYYTTGKSQFGNLDRCTNIDKRTKEYKMIEKHYRSLI